MSARIVVDRVGGPEVLRVADAPPPVPGTGQLVVAAEAAGVAFADVLMRQGRYPQQPKLPFTPGYDVVGTVTAVGPGVDGFAVGDRVAAMTITGGYAAEVLAPAKWAVRAPAGVDAAKAVALVLNYVTAWQLLHRVAAVGPGGSVLVHSAAGGVGSALTELAGLTDIRVFGIASATRRPVLEARGVTVVADATAVPEPVDATFDAVGGPSIAVSRRATRRDGVVAAFGLSFAVDRGLGRVGGLARHVGALATARVTPGAKVRTYVATSRPPSEQRVDLAALLGLLEEGAIDPEVTTLPLAEAAEAQRRLEAREVVGKLVLAG